MKFFTDRWRRLGTRLYIALGFAVFLTIVSSAVGVYYFEQSGDLNFQVRSQSVPALEAAWSATREGERLRSLGLDLLAESDSPSVDLKAESVAEVLARMESAVAEVKVVPELESEAEAVLDVAYDLAGVVDNIALNRSELLEARAATLDLRSRLEKKSVGADSADPALNVLGRALSATDQPALDGLWDEFAGSPAAGTDPVLRELGASDQGVFAARGRELVLEDREIELAAAFDASGLALETGLSGLVSEAGAESTAALESTVGSFDQGRLLLVIISVASVIAATLAAWLWVGNGLVRRLSRLSDRMRLMARGDLEMPVPEVGRDEIGELADALEVFRQQALEVQRLNLVEQLYGELQAANDELTRMQDRLVAQEKLAALGELVSGVAHEISNPLNFVKNFSEGSVDLYAELSEMIAGYRNVMTEEDAAALDEIGQELKDSLDRVISNGGRVLSIVERMRGLGVVGGEPAPSDMNAILRLTSQAACSSFKTEWGDFAVEPVFDLDESVGPIPLVINDFGEAVKNLVSNACYAMRTKRQSLGDDYKPLLLVSSQQVGDVVEIRFRDNGTGIPDDIVGRIFNPFFSTRDGVLGAGLGLPVASDVVRRTGGDLSVNTVRGEYAEFVMSLPVDQSVAVS